MCYDGMFADFPDIRWIIGHLGGAIPYLMERMDNGFRDFADCRVKIDKLPSFYLKQLYYDTVSFSSHTLTMTIARSDPSVEQRKLAVRYLGESKDPEALKFLEELLK